MNHSITPIARVAVGVRLLAALCLGVFAGGMLTEGCVLVPIWRALAPGDFLAWYAVHGDRLHAFFSPLTSAAALLAVAAAAVSFWEGHRARWTSLASAGFALAAVASFFLYFSDANASFARGTLSLEQVGPELTRWATWHWGRTALVFASALLALLSVRVPR
jgi:Domain of unknown function (DUF1772)